MIYVFLSSSAAWSEKRQPQITRQLSEIASWNSWWRASISWPSLLASPYPESFILPLLLCCPTCKMDSTHLTADGKQALRHHLLGWRSALTRLPQILWILVHSRYFLHTMCGWLNVFSDVEVAITWSITCSHVPMSRYRHQLSWARDANRRLELLPMGLKHACWSYYKDLYRCNRSRKSSKPTDLFPKKAFLLWPRCQPRF